MGPQSPRSRRVPAGVPTVPPGTKRLLLGRNPKIAERKALIREEYGTLQLQWVRNPKIAERVDSKAQATHRCVRASNGAAILRSRRGLAGERRRFESLQSGLRAPGLSVGREVTLRRYRP